jgi:hypothetical protein
MSYTAAKQADPTVRMSVSLLRRNMRSASLGEHPHFGMWDADGPAPSGGSDDEHAIFRTSAVRPSELTSPSSPNRSGASASHDRGGQCQLRFGPAAEAARAKLSAATTLARWYRT